MSPVGRPRADPRASTADPQEEILMAAANLFASVGYTAASTRIIAEAVGLRQASLFHYYPRKEAILAELLDRTVRPALELTRRLEHAAVGPEATLWVLAERDVRNLCTGSHNLGILQLLPEARADQFAWFWRRRQRLFAFYRRQIRAGAAAGLFPAGTGPTAADLVFGLVESVITAKPAVRADPQIPAEVADASLRLLGVPQVRLDRARRRALAFIEHDPPVDPASRHDGTGRPPESGRPVKAATAGGLPPP
jgi:AcrR family transcriptional regulator